MFMFIKAYSEYMAYSGIFEPEIDLVSFRHIIQVVLRSKLCIFWTLFMQIQVYLELWLI